MKNAVVRSIYQSFGLTVSFFDSDAGEQLCLTKALVPDDAPQPYKV